MLALKDSLEEKVEKERKREKCCLANQMVVSDLKVLICFRLTSLSLPPFSGVRRLSHRRYICYN